MDARRVIRHSNPATVTDEREPCQGVKRGQALEELVPTGVPTEEICQASVQRDKVPR
jgi:hypothetical protein